MAHSINFVPRARLVIDQIAGLSKPLCRLRMSFTNPYVHGAWQEATGSGFLISQDFVDEGEVHYLKREWTITDPSGKQRIVEGPREYRHSLSTIINTLIKDGFTIDGFWEEIGKEANPVVGTWEHFMKIAPPWLNIWATRNEARQHNKSLKPTP